MSVSAELLAKKLLKREWDKLTEREKKVILSFINSEQISRNVDEVFEDERTFGQRVAETVAKFGGSWRFIFIFLAVLFFWVVLNTYILLNRGFDPYPYILLNLFLSMLAAIQAPIIMMSQNRQAARDRLDADYDYVVNLMAELGIRALHEKLDEFREQRWADLVEMQQQQIRLLERLLREQMKQSDREFS